MPTQTDIQEIPLDQFISNPKESLDTLSLNGDKKIIITDSKNRYTITNVAREYKEPKCCCQNDTDWGTIMGFIFLCVVVISLNFGGK